MLQKTKSKQIQLLKYALLIPMVLGMLVYASCSDDPSNTTQNEIDLSKYGYTIKISSNGLAEVPADKHLEYETFLKNNPNYVAWAQTNEENTEMTYSVHSKDEVVPENLSKSGVSFPDGSSYVMYIHFPNNNQSNSKVASILIKRIDAIKDQIQVQDNISKEEEKGIELLVKMVTLNSDDVNQELIQEVHAFNDAKNKSDLHQKTTNLFNTIQEQGNITNEEELALKTLLTLVSKKGLNSAFYEEVKDQIEVPFAVIEIAPAFPDAKSFSSEAEKKQHFNATMSSYVMKNFNSELAKELDLTGEQKISVFFKIAANGEIEDIKVRSPHPKLDAEAIRVISMLPTMIPGEQKGKKVAVPYYLPIKFQIND